MNNKISIVIDLTKNAEDVWKQIDAATEIINKMEKKPWYKRIVSWF